MENVAVIKVKYPQYPVLWIRALSPNPHSPIDSQAWRGFIESHPTSQSPNAEILSIVNTGRDEEISTPEKVHFFSSIL